MDLKELKLTSSSEHARHPWELARMEVIYSLLKSLAPELLEKEATIFDIGCGDIYLIQQLSKRIPQWQFYAVDTAFDDTLLSIYDVALKGSNIKAFNSLESAYKSMNVARVDIVLLLDVIEHIENDVGFLADLQQSALISVDTKFLITVPAYQSLFCSHDVFLAHHRRYSRRLLSTNVQRAGLLPFETGYFFGSLVMPRILQVVREKIFPKKKDDAKGVGAWKGKGGIDDFVKNVLLLDFRTSRFFSRKLRITLPGLSTYVFCKTGMSRDAA
jgi:trans-aconitate methyltransferase